MKKIKIYPVVLFTALALFWGCQPPVSTGSSGSTTGEIAISITENLSRILVPSLSMVPTSYGLTGAGPQGASFNRTVTGGEHTETGLASGSWVITATALNAAGTPLGQSSVTVEVLPGKTAPAALIIRPFEGFGQMNLSLSWPPSEVPVPKVTATLTPGTGTARVLAFQVNPTSGTATFSASDVGTGYHTLAIRLYSNDVQVAGAVEVVRMVKDQSTAGAIAFTKVRVEDGTLDISLTPELQEPLSLQIVGGGASKYRNQSLNLEALTLNYAGTVSYTWFVDGLQAGTGSSFAVGTTWKPGPYRIDVAAYSTDGKKAGNATLQVEVLPEDSPQQASYVPYIGPYLTLLAPTLSGTNKTPTALDPATSMVINYESKAADPQFSAKAEYRTVGAGQWQLKTEDVTEAFPAEFGKVHHITLTGLQPDTEYEYRVLGPEGTASASYVFRTAKTQDSSSRFLIIGDQQDDEVNQRWQDISEEIFANHMNDFDFIITVGDMVRDDETANGDRFYWWRVFFIKGRDLFARKPIYPAMGNHDTPANPTAPGYNNTYWSNAEDTRSFRKYFYISPDMSNADYYSFSRGHSLFLSLNSEIPVFYGRHPSLDTGNHRAAQEAWIDATLAASTQSWNISYFHVPPINPAANKDEVQYVRPWISKFNGKLDWNLAGHVHTYHRVRPATGTATTLDFHPGYGLSSGQGTGYLLSAPSGQTPRANPGIPYLEAASSPHNHLGQGTSEIGFTLIQIVDQQFSLKTFGMGDTAGTNPAGYGDNGEKRLLDSLSYTRTPSAKAQTLPMVNFRSSANAWNTVAMTLTADHTWETTFLVTPGDTNPRYKFHTSQGDTWYGDTNLDGVASSSESDTIKITTGVGTYKVRFNDQTLAYTLTKQ